MKRILELWSNFTIKLESGKDISLLLFRLVLAYGFYMPAKMKWADIGAIAQWFDGMGIPLPTLNAYLAAGTEAVGVVLLALGLGTRLISIPLIITMIVAIITVHLGNGFDAGDNGLEIPLYYILMLSSLFFMGAGRFSLDRLFGRNKSI